MRLPITNIIERNEVVKERCYDPDEREYQQAQKKAAAAPLPQNNTQPSQLAAAKAIENMNTVPNGVSADFYERYAAFADPNRAETVAIANGRGGNVSLASLGVDMNSLYAQAMDDETFALINSNPDLKAQVLANPNTAMIFNAKQGSMGNGVNLNAYGAVSNTGNKTSGTLMDIYQSNLNNSNTNTKVNTANTVKGTTLADAYTNKTNNTTSIAAKTNTQTTTANKQTSTTAAKTASTTAAKTTTTAAKTTTTSTASKTTTTGTSSNSGLMKLNQDSIGTLITNINSAVSSVESTINSLNTNEINKINNSWAAKEASEYVARVNEAINRIKKVNEGLRLLSKTYSKVVSQSNATQSQVSSYINGLF